MHHNLKLFFSGIRQTGIFDPPAAGGYRSPVWSQQNTRLLWKGYTEELWTFPGGGWARRFTCTIPYLPLHADDIDRDAENFLCWCCLTWRVMTDGQMVRATICTARRQPGRNGDSSLLDEWGDPRTDFGLADLLGPTWLSPVTPRHARRALKLSATYITLTLSPTAATSQSSWF